MKLFEYTDMMIPVQYFPESGIVRAGTEIPGYPLTLIMARLAMAVRGAGMTFAELGVALRVVNCEIVSMSENILPLRRRP